MAPRPVPGPIVSYSASCGPLPRYATPGAWHVTPSDIATNAILPRPQIHPRAIGLHQQGQTAHIQAGFTREMDRRRATHQRELSPRVRAATIKRSQVQASSETARLAGTAGRPGLRPGDADRRCRGLAHGPAPCRPGRRSPAGRRAPSRGRREPPSRVQTGRTPGARLRCSPDGPPGRSHGGAATLDAGPDTPPTTPAKTRRTPRETAAELTRLPVGPA